MEGPRPGNAEQEGSGSTNVQAASAEEPMQWPCNDLIDDHMHRAREAGRARREGSRTAADNCMIDSIVQALVHLNRSESAACMLCCLATPLGSTAGSWTSRLRLIQRRHMTMSGSAASGAYQLDELRAALPAAAAAAPAAATTQPGAEKIFSFGLLSDVQVVGVEG